MAWTFRDHVNDLLVHTCNEHLYELLSKPQLPFVLVQRRPFREIFWSAVQSLTWFPGGPKVSTYDQLRPESWTPRHRPDQNMYAPLEAWSSRTTSAILHEQLNFVNHGAQHFSLVLENGMQISWYNPTLDLELYVHLRYFPLSSVLLV